LWPATGRKIDEEIERARGDQTMTSSVHDHYNCASLFTTTNSGQTSSGNDNASATGSESDSTSEFMKLLQSFRQMGPDLSALAEITSGDGNDEVNASAQKVRIDSGTGSDTVDAVGYDVAVNGGDGDDTINAAGYKVVVKGGAGNDVINAGSIAPRRGPIPLGQVSGGDGDDIIHTSGLMGYVNGGAGNDTIHASDSSLIEAFGGTGDDTIIADRGGLNLYGGAGNDTIVSRGNLFHGNVFGGAGDDTATISGRGVEAYGGTGDDDLTLEDAESLIGYKLTEDGPKQALEFRSIVNGGIGDDNITLNGSYGDIQYYAGDGNDTITGADERSVLNLGPGLSFEDTTFSAEGNDLKMAFADGGSITFKDYQSKGLPRIQYDGGRLLDASTTIAYAGGDPDAYTANDMA